MTIFNVKFDSLPLTNIFFVISYSIPITCNLIFFVTILNFVWRLEGLQESLELKSDLKIVSKIFNRTCDTITLMNQYHVLNTIVAMLNMLGVMITITFLLYDITVHSLRLNNFFIIAGGYSYVITSGLICLIIYKYSSKIDNLMNEISMEVNNYGNADKKYQKRAQLASLNFLNSKNEISCGLFKLNWSHIFTIIASFYSYLITMIQFDAMINENY